MTQRSFSAMAKVFHSPDTGGRAVKPAQRLDTLTGLRGYAALLVVAFHISLNRFFAGDAGFVEPGKFLLSNAGWFGVTFFFVLSGFVLTWSLREDDTPGRFMWRRMALLWQLPVLAPPRSGKRWQTCSCFMPGSRVIRRFLASTIRAGLCRRKCFSTPCSRLPFRW
ncbi:acyltransferase [Roseibium hamelinense]|nr:acyltransferase [Roseibium hamelinense]